MERISGKTSQLGPQTGHTQGIGHSLDELKFEKAKALPAEIAPMPSRELSDLIGGSRACDQIRLHVPKAANPFQAFPHGPKSDYFLLQSVVSKTSSQISLELVKMLTKPEETSDASRSFMRASLAREHSMLELIKSLSDSMGQVHHRIVGSQEG